MITRLRARTFIQISGGWLPNGNLEGAEDRVGKKKSELVACTTTIGRLACGGLEIYSVAGTGGS